VSASSISFERVLKFLDVARPYLVQGLEPVEFLKQAPPHLCEHRFRGFSA
jgi:hypothetical protein